MSVISDPQPPYPLHDSVKDLLDPEYVKFYNQYVANLQQVHLQPVAASRTGGVLIPGGGPLLDVGQTEDIAISRRETEGPEILLRAFTPSGEKPAAGWPVMLYFHGGGWVLGNINTENPVCTNLCVRGNCVVVTVDYRLVPLAKVLPKDGPSDRCFKAKKKSLVGNEKPTMTLTDWLPKTAGRPPSMTVGRPYSG